MMWKSLRRKHMAVLGTLAALGFSSPLSAQVPGAPVLQNAFTNPGLAFAANFGTGGGQSFFGAAAGWGLGGGRLLVSGAAGVQRANEASRGAYGGRAAATVWTSGAGALAVGAFAGIGGAPRTRDAAGVENNAAQLNIPAGLTIGYRRALGDVRGFSVYASPMYKWSRAEVGNVSESAGNFAGAVGLDFGLTQSIGLTVGGEFGNGSGVDNGSLLGFAVSFVPGRR
jgi:hypothetical protein